MGDKHEVDVNALVNSTDSMHDIVPHMKDTQMEQYIVLEHQANVSRAFTTQHSWDIFALDTNPHLNVENVAQCGPVITRSIVSKI